MSAENRKQSSPTKRPSWMGLPWKQLPWQQSNRDGSPWYARTFRITSVRVFSQAFFFSLFMFLLFSCGVLLWLIYGILLHAWPIILANGVTLALSTSILVLKIKYMLVGSNRAE